jgi:hypothetical protein
MNEKHIKIIPFPNSRQEFQVEDMKWIPPQEWMERAKAFILESFSFPYEKYPFVNQDYGQGIGNGYYIEITLQIKREVPDEKMAGGNQ